MKMLQKGIYWGSHGRALEFNRMAVYIHPGVDSGLRFQAGSRLPPQAQTHAGRLEAPWPVHSEMSKELETNISSARHEHPERKGLACNDMLTSFFGEDIAQVQSGSFPHLCFISLHSRKASANSFFHHLRHLRAVKLATNANHPIPS